MTESSLCKGLICIKSLSIKVTLHVVILYTIRTICKSNFGKPQLKFTIVGDITVRLKAIMEAFDVEGD